MVNFNEIHGFAFDLDGVLTDTARFHGQAWHQIADKVGTSWTPALADSLRGISRMDSLELILKAGHHEQDYTQAQKEALAAEKNTNYLQLIQQLTPDDLLPGIPEFLQELQSAGFKASIASASKNAPTILDKLRIASDFVGVVDANTLQKGKPDPEIFLKAAAILKLPPQQVIGLEDAAAGIAAINAAGEVSVGIGSAERLSAAAIRFDDTSQLTLAAIKVAPYFK